MNKPMRKVSIALAVLFLALFVNLNYVQIVKGSSYRDNPANHRVLLNEYSTPRGQIVVQGTAVADSTATKDELKYKREYANGAVYAPATGYYSFVYGSSGIEQAENEVLSGDSPQLFTSKLANILTGRNPSGGSVNLTLNKAAQEAAYAAMKGANGQLRRGAVVALDPTTGKILALVSTPSYNPNDLASHNGDEVSTAWQKYLKDPNQPLLDRALAQTYPAGSIFKIIDAAAALKAGLTPSSTIPAPNSYWPYDPKKTTSCPASLNAACVQNFAGETCQNGKTASLDYAFAKSCNTAFAALAVEKLGGKAIQSQASAFGFDNPSTLHVPLSVIGSTIGMPADLADPA
ncbi:MAG: penicillin-binding protein 2, partial [Actinobacteria bacterium]|nr:penicillin-binding protein 2 [Actinomycetota bacterium]